MRLATWNVNGMRARLEFVLAWLRERRPDAVGLQEIKTLDEQFPREAVEAEGYHVLTHGQKSWNGVAVLSREPAELVERGLPSQEEFGSRLLTARLSGGIDFTTVYVPNGKSRDHPDYPKKLAWLDALAEHLAAKHDPHSGHVLCGDFNVCPTELDTWNEEKLAGSIFHTDAERERMRRLLDWGFVDSFRTLHPEERVFSWWDYRFGAFHRRQGLRIDLVLATAPVQERVKSVAIDREWRKKRDGMTPSDHTAVWIDLD